MFDKLKFWCCIFFCTFCMYSVVYGNEVNNLEDLLDEDIGVKDKLEYLDYLKNHSSSFSKKDIKTIIKILGIRLQETYEVGNDYSWKQGKIIDIDKITIKLLEIFLKDEINENILEQSLLSELAVNILGNFPLKGEVPISSELRFVALKALIKINILKLNSDDNFLKNMREKIIREDEVGNTEQLINSRNAYYEKKWEFRDPVENQIFEPILLNEKIDNPYIEEDPKVLYEYEKYLLDHIKYFYINDHLKELVEDAFFVTKYKEFDSKYVDIMFYLDMKEALLRIISDTTRIDNLREQAIEVGVKLLKEVDPLSFKYFSDLLLYKLEKIVKDVREKEELKKLAEEKIKEIQSIIDSYDEMDRLKNIVLDKSISESDKLKYLNDTSNDRIYFSRKDSEFIKEVLNNEDITILVKAAISTHVCKSKEFDQMDIGIEDKEALDFLSRAFVDDKNVVLFEDVEETDIWREKVMKQLSRFDMWDMIMCIVSSKEEQDSYRKLAIKTCLNLFPNTKHFEAFSNNFLNTLRRISEDADESMDLRNIVDYILVYTKSDKMKLKEGIKSCKMLFMF